MRIRVIINPSAGRQIFQKNAERIIDLLVRDGTFKQVDRIRTEKAGDAYQAARYFYPWQVDAILVVGGDGTVNEVVNGLIDGKQCVPLAILPAGTVNDFAHALKLPREVEAFCDMMRHFKTRFVDVGMAGRHCFLNVAAGGMLTDIAYRTTSEAKTILGQLAYVLNGALDLPAQLFQTIPITIRSQDRLFEDDIQLFIVANTCSVGGFRNFAPAASVQDGLLDVVVLHGQNLFDFLPLMLQIVNGEHVNNKSITYFQADSLSISCREHCQVPLDLDGEQCEHLPVEIRVLPQTLQLIVPETDLLGHSASPSST